MVTIISHLRPTYKKIKYSFHYYLLVYLWAVVLTSVVSTKYKSSYYQFPIDSVYRNLFGYRYKIYELLLNVSVLYFILILF